MKPITQLLCLLFALATAGTYAQPASAQVTCVMKYAQLHNPKALGFSPTDVERLVGDVATAIGLSVRGIHIIPCDGVGKVQSIYYHDRTDIANGDYIFYDTIWVREVLGNKLAEGTQTLVRDQAIVVFGHELGHLLGRHFTSNADMPQIQKETEADHFAGCAAAVMNVGWSSVQDILRRIRPELDTDYPSQAHSLEAAKSGYDVCGKGNRGDRSVDPGEITLAWQRLNLLDETQVAALAQRSQTYLRDQSQPDAITPVAKKLVELTQFDYLKSYGDPTRRSLYSALIAVPATWWDRPETAGDRDALRNNLVFIDSVVNQPPRSVETSRALDELKRQLYYQVPPGRIISAGPFRMRVDYCGAATCDFQMFVRGYDERGNLRLIADAPFQGMRQGEVRDTTLNSNGRMYFEINQQLVQNRPIAFRLFCKYSGQVLAGNTTEITWSAANEVNNGYAKWLSCKSPAFQASLGFDVKTSPDRAAEPPVSAEPGPPR